MKHDPSRCMRCGACVNVCPSGALELEDTLLMGDGCLECLACAAVCPVDAMECQDEV
ncbi:4Fe-4S binding protein [Methanothermobacter marburgensis]|uniref:4Fe-4S binding protein n=1 Tax=Methanothermobacter marburgensis TaxID=145263 RepID=UPI001EE5860D|nr:4Fe-4S binding protein [Methanothermobacter marburgensis]